MTQFLKQLAKESDIDVDRVKQELKNTVKKTIISMVPFLKSFAKKYINTDIQKIK